MVRRYNRLLVSFHVVSDAILGIVSFLVAYTIRFDAGLIPVTKGYPPLEQYINVLPLIALLVPLCFHSQKIYRLHQGRSRVDDFFAVLIGTILVVVLGLIGTLYFQAYYVSLDLKTRGAYEISQLVWGLFFTCNIGLTFLSRELVREFLERRWRAGIGLKRILMAGSGELGRLIADKALSHRELGWQVIGFIDDRANIERLGYRGLPLLGTLSEADAIMSQESIDQLYIALPLEEHVKMLELIEVAGRECIDVKVIPDLLQFIALGARLEDLDGIPIININDVPLQGFNSAFKHISDVAISSAIILLLAIPFAIIAAIIKMTSLGPVFYRQERMGLDGKRFLVYKFRSMFEDAEKGTGPVWAIDNDPRTTPVGKLLRRSNFDEFPQLWNVIRGEMSLVGPRPERPFFVEKFKQRIPQYMLRHKVKSGMTGWAQVNGWRGDTSIEKRIEYDLYYIENWSTTLDIKILFLTFLILIRGFFNNRAS